MRFGSRQLRTIGASALEYPVQTRCRLLLTIGVCRTEARPSPSLQNSVDKPSRARRKPSVSRRASSSCLPLQQALRAAYDRCSELGEQLRCVTEVLEDERQRCQAFHAKCLQRDEELELLKHRCDELNGSSILRGNSAKKIIQWMFPLPGLSESCASVGSCASSQSTAPTSGPCKTGMRAF